VILSLFSLFCTTKKEKKEEDKQGERDVWRHRGRNNVDLTTLKQNKTRVTFASFIFKFRLFLSFQFSLTRSYYLLPLSLPGSKEFFFFFFFIIIFFFFSFFFFLFSFPFLLLLLPSSLSLVFSFSHIFPFPPCSLTLIIFSRRKFFTSFISSSQLECCILSYAFHSTFSFLAPIFKIACFALWPPAIGLMIIIIVIHNE